MDTRVTFLCEKEDKELLLRLKRDTGVPFSELIRRALDAYLERYGPTPGGLGLVKKSGAQSLVRRGKNMTNT